MRSMRFALFFLGIAALSASAGTLTFEGFDDLTILTNQYPGAVFTNTVILKQFYSLNEGEFPPRSGDNVASFLGGPVVIMSLAYNVAWVEAYITYDHEMQMTAYDSSFNQVDQDTSAFDNNTLVSGDPGSAPNEFFRVAGNNISIVIFSPTGSTGLFTIDDVAFLPEPATWTLMLAAGGLLSVSRRFRRSK